MANDVLIEANDLTKKFPMGQGEITALNHVNLHFQKGEFAGLVGPSGSGKTTLLNIIGSLDSPSEGSVTVMDKKVEMLSHKESAWLRNKYIGFIFQTFNLLPVYTVYENVEFPLLLLKTPAADRKKAVLQALEWVNLSDRIKSKPSQLSGGEGQRVAIARAMVKQPEIMLVDEATANLDAKNSHQILQTMASLNQELNTTFIFSTHDEKVIQYLKRIITLDDGKIMDDRRINNGKA